MDAIRRLYEWLAEGTDGLPPPVEPATIAAFEEKNGVTVPDDVRAFLSLANGAWTRRIETDGEFNEWWPIEGWHCFDNGYVVFADFAIECAHFAICMNAADDRFGSVVRIGCPSSSLLAESFGEFAMKTVADPPRATYPDMERVFDIAGFDVPWERKAPLDWNGDPDTHRRIYVELSKGSCDIAE